MGIFLVVAGILLALIASGIQVVKQYEKGLILTLGRYTGTKNPGLNFIIPVVQRMYKVDMRLATVDIPRQEVITKDNVTINVDAVVYFRVSDAQRAILDVQNFRLATAQYAHCLLYTSPSPRDQRGPRMPSSA